MIQTNIGLRQAQNVYNRVYRDKNFYCEKRSGRKGSGGRLPFVTPAFLRSRSSFYIHVFLGRALFPYSVNTVLVNYVTITLIKLPYSDAPQTVR